MNDFVTEYYHLSTNKHKLKLNENVIQNIENHEERIESDYLVQLLEKRSRIEFYDVNGKLADFIFIME